MYKSFFSSSKMIKVNMTKINTSSVGGRAWVPLLLL